MKSRRILTRMAITSALLAITLGILGGSDLALGVDTEYFAIIGYIAGFIAVVSFIGLVLSLVIDSLKDK